MDLERMLRMCRDGQWSVTDVDWSRAPRAMSRDDEIAIVQLFTDMSTIERLAGALFVEQEKRVSDPTLKQIFASFVKDEVRHAHAAQLLADHYDVHHYAVYRTSHALERFFPAFVSAIGELSDDVANTYITCGELILDVALLRSIDDYVHDETSAAVMALINRDESRHIAIDYFMVEHYASDAYKAERTRARRSLAAEARAWRTFARVLLHARPFFRSVFFEPMRRIDPSGRRIREAFKRMQLLAAKPALRELPFVRFIEGLRAVHNSGFAGPRARQVLARIAGSEPELLDRLATDDELARARDLSFDELAEDALAAKYAS